MQIEEKYTPHDDYDLIEDYEEVVGDWLPCPNCRLMPKVWIFGNGRFTGCGCRIDRYNHFSIHAECTMSHYTNNNMVDYDDDELRKNWNKWALTGEIVFDYDFQFKTNNRW